MSFCVGWALVISALAYAEPTNLNNWDALYASNWNQLVSGINNARLDCITVTWPKAYLAQTTTNGSNVSYRWTSTVSCNWDYELVHCWWINDVKIVHEWDYAMTNVFPIDTNTVDGKTCSANSWILQHVDTQFASNTSNVIASARCCRIVK